MIWHVAKVLCRPDHAVVIGIEKGVTAERGCQRRSGDTFTATVGSVVHDTSARTAVFAKDIYAEVGRRGDRHSTKIGALHERRTKVDQ